MLIVPVDKTPIINGLIIVAVVLKRFSRANSFTP